MSNQAYSCSIIALPAPVQTVADLCHGPHTEPHRLMQVRDQAGRDWLVCLPEAAVIARNWKPEVKP